METFTDNVMRDLCAHSLETATLGDDGWRDVGEGPGSDEGRYVDWLTIDDREEAVVQDVRRIRQHPLVPSDIVIHGFLYDVASGRLVDVQEATRVGRGQGAEQDRRAPPFGNDPAAHQVT